MSVMKGNEISFYQHHLFHQKPRPGTPARGPWAGNMGLQLPEPQAASLPTPHGFPVLRTMLFTCTSLTSPNINSCRWPSVPVPVGWSRVGGGTVAGPLGPAGSETPCADMCTLICMPVGVCNSEALRESPCGSTPRPGELRQTGPSPWDHVSCQATGCRVPSTMKTQFCFYCVCLFVLPPEKGKLLVLNPMSCGWLVLMWQVWEKGVPVNV